MSNDTILYTVGEVAERFSLTVRTLHHWEAQGLLAPTARSWSNYRLYSAEDCARVQRIVIYRATGMKLMDIKSLLDSGDTEVEHLKRQRESLVAHRRETDAMIEALDILLEDAMNDKALTVEEIGEILGKADFAAHQSEAEERYGDTDDWRESRVRTASWQAADWRQNVERFQDIECRMIDAIMMVPLLTARGPPAWLRNTERLSASSSGHARQALHHVSRVHPRRAIPGTLRLTAGGLRAVARRRDRGGCETAGSGPREPHMGVSIPDKEVAYP